MANKKISELDAFQGNVQNDDLFEIVDVSDSSMAPTGTNKKVTWQDMKGDLNDIYLRLNGANGPMTGDLAVTGNVNITGEYRINGAPITGGGIPDVQAMAQHTAETTRHGLLFQMEQQNF